jgi:sugar lactone lactonase YvrE
MNTGVVGTMDFPSEDAENAEDKCAHLGALWVSDMRGGKVFRIDLDGKATIVADVPTRPSGQGFLPDGSLVVASMTQRLILKFGAEKPTIHADLTDVASGYPSLAMETPK